MRCRAAAVGAMIMVSVLGACSAAAARTDSAGTPASASTVLGYIESGDGLAALRPNLAGLTIAGVDGVNVNQAGSGVSAPDGDARAMLSAAHRAHKPAELLVGNYSSIINDFDPAIAHRLFVSARNRATVVAALVADARHGWDGIELDFESLHGSDMAGLTRFTHQLRRALPSRTTLGIAVMASTTAAGYRDDAYDLRALSSSVNRVVLMAYDQHGPTWTSAGPVGGLPWAEAAMTTMLRFVPRTKAVLGVAGYGYTWPTHGTGRQLSDAASRSQAVRPVWDATQGEWHSTLRGGGTLWWSDAKSLRRRRDVARHLKIQGVAVWSLGLSDHLPH